MMAMMKIVSFNVNSIRSRLHQLQALVAKHDPDIIGLQETKVTDADFPASEIEKLGYNVTFHGQKTHYGVALLSRAPMQSVIKGFPSDTEAAQRRLIGCDIRIGGKTLTVINGYFPQGESRAHTVKFPAKEKFYQDLLALLQDSYKPSDRLVVLGDFNVAPVDEDIGLSADNAKRWLRTGKASFLPEEREWLQRIFEWGLADTYRVKYPKDNNTFSWFDYRSRGFEKDPKRGLRIDHVLATAPMTNTLKDAGIDYDIRGMEKPSDHCPVWSMFKLKS